MRCLSFLKSVDKPTLTKRGASMARDNDWIAVTIKNKKTGESITMYHPPTKGAGKAVDDRLQSIFEIPEPSDPRRYKPDDRVPITTRPGPAEWLTKPPQQTAIPPASRRSALSELV